MPPKKAPKKKIRSQIPPTVPSLPSLPPDVLEFQGCKTRIRAAWSFDLEETLKRPSEEDSDDEPDWDTTDDEADGDYYDAQSHFSSPNVSQRSSIIIDSPSSPSSGHANAPNSPIFLDSPVSSGRHSPVDSLFDEVSNEPPSFNLFTQPESYEFRRQAALDDLSALMDAVAVENILLTTPIPFEKVHFNFPPYSRRPRQPAPPYPVIEAPAMSRKQRFLAVQRGKRAVRREKARGPDGSKACASKYARSMGQVSADFNMLDEDDEPDTTVEMPDAVRHDILPPIAKTSTSWTGLNQSFEKTEYTRSDLDKLGLKLVDWSGDKLTAITGLKDYCIAFLVPPPKEKDSWKSSMQECATAMESAKEEMKKKRVKRSAGRRGVHQAISYGFSMGGGQTAPRKTRNGVILLSILTTLVMLPCFQRITGYTSGVFALCASQLFQYYGTTLSTVISNDLTGTLAKAFANSVFAAFTFNIGPHTCTWPHTDHANLAFGWCSITALGNFDPNQGGHIVLWNLGLYIRFPPGCTIFLPSAIITHSNLAIQEGETRYSFVQYTSGGIFRWAYNGCQVQTKFMAKATKAQLAKWNQDKSNRWQFGMGLHTKFSELRAGRVNRPKPVIPSPFNV
ncbi:hypothetical protein C8J56DRAFT_979476 [Mycena floridula]|nr:hypothetical protein C8J56DRAFT_979476 [Mycena floridula]